MMEAGHIDTDLETAIHVNCMYFDFDRKPIEAHRHGEYMHTGQGGETQTHVIPQL